MWFPHKLLKATSKSADILLGGGCGARQAGLAPTQPSLTPALQAQLLEKRVIGTRYPIRPEEEQFICREQYTDGRNGALGASGGPSGIRAESATGEEQRSALELPRTTGDEALREEGHNRRGVRALTTHTAAQNRRRMSIGW